MASLSNKETKTAKLWTWHMTECTQHTERSTPEILISLYDMLDVGKWTGSKYLNGISMWLASWHAE